MEAPVLSESFVDRLARCEARPVQLDKEEMWNRRRDLAIGGELNRLQGERPSKMTERLDRLFGLGQASRDEVVELTREAYRLGLLDKDDSTSHER